MSALSLATLGVQCKGASRATSMATLGVFCRGLVIDEVEFGGHQFLVFKPIIDSIKGQIPVDAIVLPYLEKTPTEFEIDGKPYDLVARRTPKEIINAAPDIEKILDSAMEKLGMTRRQAKQELYKQVINELKEVESLKDSVFNDDEEIIMILVATDDL